MNNTNKKTNNCTKTSVHWAWELYLFPYFLWACTTTQNNLSQSLISIPYFTVVEVRGEHLFLIHSKPTIFLILIYVHCAECFWLEQTVIYIPITIKEAQQPLPSLASNLAVEVVTKYNISAAIRQAALYSYEFSATSKNPMEKELQMRSTALEEIILFFVALLG